MYDFEKSRLLDLYPGFLGSTDLMKVWEQEYEVNEKSLKKKGMFSGGMPFGKGMIR